MYCYSAPPDRGGDQAGGAVGGQRRTVLHPLEFAALLTAARRDGPHSHGRAALERAVRHSQTRQFTPDLAILQVGVVASLTGVVRLALRELSQRVQHLDGS